MRLLALVSVIVIVVCADASAQQSHVSTIRLFDEQGDPQLVVYDASGGGLGSVAWSTCPPAGTLCYAAGAWQTSTGAGMGETFTAGRTAAGTVLRADGVWEGQPIAFRATWLGAVTAVAPPVLRGRAVVGTRVQATAGSWSGGWGDELDALRVQACRTRAALSCATLGPVSGRLGGATDGPVTIDARFTGWYLFAVDNRVPREVPYPAVATVASPSVNQRFVSGPTVSMSTPVGPIVGPTAVIRARALYRDRRPQLGTVRCPIGCTAKVTVRRGAVTRTRTLRVTGTKAIAPRLQLRPGVWRVTVTIDGGRAAQRRVAVRDR